MKQLVFLALTILFLSNSAHADKVPIHEDLALIQECKDKQPTFPYLGADGLMVPLQGSYAEYAACLEGIILRLGKKIYPAKQQKELPNQLRRLYESYSSFYYTLHNENKWCDCGRFAEDMADAAYPELLEQMIKDMWKVKHANEELDGK